MTEEKFWTEFFRSRHFHRERYTTSKPSKDLFGECAEIDEQKQLEENIRKLMDPMLDLTNSESIPEEVCVVSSIPLNTACNRARNGAKLFSCKNRLV